MKTTTTDEAIKIAYDEGYEDGQADAECDMYTQDEAMREYDRGYEDAERDMKHEIKEKESELMASVLARAAINPLENFVGRWDAALRAWVLSQDGREMIVRKEG